MYKSTPLTFCCSRISPASLRRRANPDGDYFRCLLPQWRRRRATTSGTSGGDRGRTPYIKRGKRQEKTVCDYLLACLMLSKGTKKSHEGVLQVETENYLSKWPQTSFLHSGGLSEPLLSEFDHVLPGVPPQRPVCSSGRQQCSPRRSRRHSPD